jgi:hypothetical protein
MRQWRRAITVLIVFGAGSALADVSETFDEGQMATPGPSEAAVYFVRPAKMGFAINFWSFVDEKPVGVTKGNNYTFGVVPAGEHIVWSRSGNVSALRVQLEAGKSYYFEQKVRMGGMRARVELVSMSEADAQAAIADAKYTKLTEEGVLEGNEHSAKDYAEAQQGAQPAAP